MLILKYERRSEARYVELPRATFPTENVVGSRALFEALLLVGVSH